GSNEEPYANIWEEISNVNTAVPKSEEFKTFTLSKVSFKRKNATEDEEKSPLNQEEKPFRPNISSHKKSSVSSKIRTALQKARKKMKTWLRRVYTRRNLIWKLQAAQGLH
uniref:Uncharacterized protein n=1 Tax=Tetraodon nigroviridis TaxID=99883 RepID=H3BZH4_TETNG